MHQTLHVLPAPRTRAPRRVDVRSIRSSTATEHYLTLTPSPGPIRRQAHEVYTALAEHLRATGSFIVQERVFASVPDIPALLDVRAADLDVLDDGVLPTLLSPPTSPGQPLLGLQVHTIRGIRPPKLLRHRDDAFARAFSHDGVHYLTASALRCPRAGAPDVQTRCALETAHALLAAAGGSLRDLARTWIWMDDILAWYDDLNRVRTAFFREHDLMTRPGQMPASTGIGVPPAGRSNVSFDLFAAWCDGDPAAPVVQRFHAIGNQRSAYDYGSAFSRAARVRTPAGLTVFCSGTAAIDAAGRTCHPDDPDAQIAMTLDNVRAVLRDMNCSPADVVQAMAYCATPATQDAFLTRYAPALPWPLLTMPGTVCRADLLFEIEVTACPPARAPTDEVSAVLV